MMSVGCFILGYVGYLISEYVICYMRRFDMWICEIRIFDSVDILDIDVPIRDRRYLEIGYSICQYVDIR